MGTRGRKAIEVAPQELQGMITEQETQQPDGKFPNRSALWSAIEATAWAKSRAPRPLTGQVAMSLAKKFNLNINTPIGVKGRVKGQKVAVATGVRKRRKLDADIVLELKKDFSEKYHKTIDKLAAGSIKGAVKAKCLDCCNQQQKEVALCTVTNCPLWNFRPYKRKESLTVEGRNRITLGMLGDYDDESESTD